MVLFDTETTGLIENRTIKIDKLPEIIEFYAIEANLDTGEVGEEIDSFVRPSIPITEFTTGKNGITNEMVADAPRFAELAPSIKALLERAPLLLAHNARFDCDMVEVELERIGEKITYPLVLCTIEQSMHYVSRRLTMTQLYEHLFEDKFPDAHRAKGDVTALLRIAVEMRRRGDL